MSSTPQPSTPRHAVWRWVLLAATLCLTPFLLLGAVAVSYLTLDSDVRTLRKHVMAATNTCWHTKVQMDVGRATLGAIGQGLRFVDHKDMDDARLALRAVRHASVGVYERDSSGPISWSREELFANTDRAMKNRGWTRLVGVSDHKEAVLVYVQADAKEEEPLDVCVAVVNGRELVVVSTAVDPRGLGELVARHAKGDLKNGFRFAKFGR